MLRRAKGPSRSMKPPHGDQRFVRSASEIGCLLTPRETQKSMILSLEQKKIDEANTVLKSLLEGAQLDRFTVFNSELDLCFYRAETPLIWLSTLQKVSLALPSKKMPTGWPDVQANRRELLPDLYGMIGEYASQVGVAVAGALEIQFTNGARLRISDFDEDEVLWSVTSESPGAFVLHDWVVTLFDTGELSVRTPKDPSGLTEASTD